MEISLDMLLPGQWVCISSVATGKDRKQQLRDLGVKNGSRIYCRYVSPSGESAALEVKDTIFSLEREDLTRIRGWC